MERIGKVQVFRKKEFEKVSCLGCGNRILLIIIPACYIISTPEMVCSEECANRHEAHTMSWSEKRNQNEPTD